MISALNYIQKLQDKDTIELDLVAHTLNMRGKGRQISVFKVRPSKTAKAKYRKPVFKGKK